MKSPTFYIIFTLVIILASYLLFPTLGTLGIAVFVPAYALIATLLFYAEKTSLNYEYKKILKSSLLHIKNSQMGILPAISKENPTWHVNVNAILCKIRRYLKMGANPMLILNNNTFEISRNPMLETHASRDCISKMVSDIDASLKKDINEVAADMQIYSTVKMFIAVILPSFILFGFVAENILSNTLNLSILIYPLLILIPALYSSMGLVMVWRFYGN